MSKVAQLRSSKAQLETDLKALRAKIDDAEGEFKTVIDQVTGTIKERIEKLRSEPAAMLADIAVIRPFLREAPNGTETKYRVPLRRLERAADVTELRTNGELVACVERNLVATGLIAASAKRLAREVLAAAQANQIVVFTGSVANALAHACARAFAGESAFEYQVPVGLLDGASLSAALSKVTQERAPGMLAALILEGLNRSALEAYGDDLRALITELQLSPASNTNRLILFGTLVRGPSALSTSAAQCELGPILDTDTLTLSSRAVAASSLGGRVSQSNWDTWCAQTACPDSALEHLQEFQESMEGEESILWRRTVRNAYCRLRSLNDGTSSSALQSLAFGWLIPRADCCHVPASEFLEELASETTAGEHGDPRVRRLLSKLFPSADARPDEKA